MPNIFSEDMNDGPLILIPLTVFQALCSTHDSCSSDQNHYQGVQHDKTTKKSVDKHGLDKRMDMNKSIQIDSLAINKRNIIVENHQAFPVQKKSIKRLSQKRSTKELNKSSCGLVTKKLKNQEKKHFSFSSCRICGEDATNYNHCGGKSCFSCRIFFKRAVEQSQRYNTVCNLILNVIIKLHPIILIYLIFYRFPSFSYACKCVERCKDNVQPLYEINKETRNACKYCRYKACITLGGMQRKLVKKNQKIIRKDDSISIE